MKVLVTGAAGFIGSHLAEALLADGHDVVGVDSFTPYYARAVKERNLMAARSHARFILVEADLAVVEPAGLLDGVEVVYHLAAQAGVRASWGRQFADYIHCNIESTQRLLEACKGRPIRKFVYASSSSVYGEPGVYPLQEDLPCRPISPYGVTKLAAEHLCLLYQHQFGVPCVALRYFTVYGPRQRPDMAFHKLIRAALRSEPFTVYSDGAQTRDFTFVKDIVSATCGAVNAPDGAVMNIGGGSRVTLRQAIQILEEVLARRVEVCESEAQKGDVRHTWAALERATELIGYRPTVDLKAGLAAEVEWLKTNGLG